MFADFVRPKGTKESQFRPAVADSCSILSVENRAGALRTRAWFALVPRSKVGEATGESTHEPQFGIKG